MPLLWWIKLSNLCYLVQIYFMSINLWMCLMKSNENILKKCLQTKPLWYSCCRISANEVNTWNVCKFRETSLIILIMSFDHWKHTQNLLDKSSFEKISYFIVDILLVRTLHATPCMGLAFDLLTHWDQVMYIYIYIYIISRHHKHHSFR